MSRKRDEVHPSPGERLRRRQVSYAYVDDVHTAVRALLKLLPSFTASYVKWMAEYGIELG